MPGAGIRYALRWATRCSATSWIASVASRRPCCRVLAGCATRPINPPLKQYEPGAGYRWSDRPDLPKNDPQTLLILAFSGGGTRAAAFSYGVLEELRRTAVGAPRYRAHHAHRSRSHQWRVGWQLHGARLRAQGRRLFPDYEHDFLTRNVEGELFRRLLESDDVAKHAVSRLRPLGTRGAVLRRNPLPRRHVCGPDLAADGDGDGIRDRHRDGPALDFLPDQFRCHLLRSEQDAPVARRRRIVGGPGRPLTGDDR